MVSKKLLYFFNENDLTNPFNEVPTIDFSHNFSLFTAYSFTMDYKTTFLNTIELKLNSLESYNR